MGTPRRELEEEHNRLGQLGVPQGCGEGRHQAGAGGGEERRRQCVGDSPDECVLRRGLFGPAHDPNVTNGSFR